jgi:hypothetical protein
LGKRKTIHEYAHIRIDDRQCSAQSFLSKNSLKQTKPKIIKSRTVRIIIFEKLMLAQKKEYFYWIWMVLI